MGIACCKWECSLINKKRGAPKDSPKITFYTWDFAGQVSTSCTVSCDCDNSFQFVLICIMQ